MATRDQTVFRVARTHKPYAQLGNAMLQDKRLSIEARGLLGSIMSRPTNWRFHVSWLMAEHAIGRDKTYRLVRELMAGGYCIRSQERTASGAWGPIEYVFTDDPPSFAALPPLPEKPDAVPRPENPHAGPPLTANPEALERRVSPKGQKDTKEKGSGLQIQPSGTDRLPFTAAVLQEIGALGVDAAAIVERYRERTAGRHIADPSAYLLRMARDETAKRLGVPVTALVGTSSRNAGERSSARAAAVGAHVEPSEAVLKGVIRRARARGDHPDEVIRAWRESTKGLPFHTSAAADRSLLAFADHRALSFRNREASQCLTRLAR